MQLLFQSNLEQLDQTDIAIIGYGHTFSFYINLFMGWKRKRAFIMASNNHLAVTELRLLALRPISGEISLEASSGIQQLRKVKCVLYIGQLGNLRPDIFPKRRLVRGMASY
jgi:hypothetical protein